MQTNFPLFSGLGLRAWILGWLVLATMLPGLADGPRIQSIRVEEAALVITADVPPGVRRLLLEGSSRGDLRGWIPRASRVIEPGVTQAVFRVPRVHALELYRVRADADLPVDPALFQGTNRFAGQVIGEGAAGPLTGFGAAGGQPEATGGQDRAAADREVAESDIWRRHGDRLYFFNPHRGLQVVDIANPGAPAVLDTLPLAGAGEQMYLLGGTHVLLLLRPPCHAWDTAAESAVVVVDVRGDRAIEVARVPVPGQIAESRLVGTALYLATQGYRALPDRWENFVRVLPVDFADPAAPAVRGALEYPGWPSAIQATPELLLLAEQGAWDQTRVRVVDISDPHGAVRERATLPVPGRVADKFKLHARGDVVSVIAESWTPRLVTTLRTFRLRPEGGHETLGRLEVGHGESLFGTRFDGDRAYLVTFLRVDPLWIIDLSDPARPRVAGELEIPGWSNHLHPLGDRLLTVGIDDVNGWRAAVQLFDVSDPSRPALLAKVPLGDSWSWSEANTDEKALAVLPEEGLVLLPFQGDRDQGVQVIDLGRDTLTARGVIRGREVVPRRSALHRERVLTVSPRELLTVNLADRDRPQIESRLELAYPVDRVLLAGAFLLEFSGPEIRVRHAQADSVVLNQVPLAEAPVLGAGRLGERLHVLQGTGRTIQWILNETTRLWEGETQPGRLVHRVHDLGALPELPLLGEATVITDAELYGDFEALEPLPGLIVWAQSGSPGGWGPWFWARPGIGFTDALWGGPRLWPWWGGWGSPVWHLAVDVSEDSRPVFRAQVSTANDGGATPRSLSPATGLVYFSTASHESEVVGTNSWVGWMDMPGPDGTIRLIEVTNHFPVLRWTEKHHLHVLDYGAGADAPARRDPVELPGPLAAAARTGHLLLATDPSPGWWAAESVGHRLHSLAYDGVSAFLLDSAGPASPDAGAPVVRGHGDRVLLGWGDGSTGRLEIWTADEDGRLVQAGLHALKSSVWELAVHGRLGLARTGAGVALFDLTPAGGQLLREQAGEACHYFQLSRGDGTPGAGAWLPGGELGAFHLAP